MGTQTHLSEYFTLTLTPTPMRETEKQVLTILRFYLSEDPQGGG